MIELTNRQQQVLDMLTAYQQKNGFPPTNAELAVMMGASSANAAAEQLRALQKKGAISIMPNVSRGIVIIDRPAEVRPEIVALIRSLVNGGENAREHAIAWLKVNEVGA